MATKNQKQRNSSNAASRAGRLSGDLYLRVVGFKAIGAPIEVRIAPLTIISGTNSAGKSSFMQPFLIMKQTLEASFDPGPLLLFGPNAKFTAISQTLSRGKSKASQARKFSVTMRSATRARTVEYEQAVDGFTIARDEATSDGAAISMSGLLPDLEYSQIENSLTMYGQTIIKELLKGSLFEGDEKQSKVKFTTQRKRCFLDLNLVAVGKGNRAMSFGGNFADTQTDFWSDLLRGIIHVPGLRGNPEREYPRSAVGRTYPGTVETYVASIIAEWAQRDPRKLELLAAELTRLGLTWKVTARKVNDAAVELLVGRMPHAQQGGAQDMVSVADVGFGVSQTLPVVVALIAASPGQIVYLEQPEIHLHPRAQVELAKVLVHASRRGVKVVTETHSSLLIRAIQTEIAAGNILAKNVSMNWFSRDEETGFSKIDVADLDDKGRFGDWPLDFDEISQNADIAYIDALNSGR